LFYEIDSRDLKSKLNDFEANKAKEIKKLEDSLTETLKSNKKAQETLDHEKVVIAEAESGKKKLLDEIASLKKEKQKAETEQKNLQAVLDKKKQVWIA
jgi:chromosome segregation ATPase